MLLQAHLCFWATKLLFKAIINLALAALPHLPLLQHNLFHHTSSYASKMLMLFAEQLQFIIHQILCI